MKNVPENALFPPPHFRLHFPLISVLPLFLFPPPSFLIVMDIFSRKHLTRRGVKPPPSLSKASLCTSHLPAPTHARLSVRAQRNLANDRPHVLPSQHHPCRPPSQIRDPSLPPLDQLPAAYRSPIALIGAGTGALLQTRGIRLLMLFMMFLLLLSMTGKTISQSLLLIILPKEFCDADKCSVSFPSYSLTRDQIPLILAFLNKMRFPSVDLRFPSSWLR